VREWESWTSAHPVEVIDRQGRPLRVVYDVADVAADVVTVTESICQPDGTALRTDRARLRFLAPGVLDRVLAEADFVVEARHGRWGGGAVRGSR
jgi:hypothetical protein